MGEKGARKGERKSKLRGGPGDSFVEESRDKELEGNPSLKKNNKKKNLRLRRDVARKVDQSERNGTTGEGKTKHGIGV